MNTYKIYKWTNLITGKGYVGQTCRPLPKRAGGRNMTGYRGCREFWKAIQEYGTDCWWVEILREGLTAEEANVYEAVEIKNHGTLTPNGYNLKDSHEGIGNQSRKSIELRGKSGLICESHLEGVPTKEIANQLGCASGTILTILHENNVKIRRNSRKERRRTDIEEKADFICKSYREGVPVKEIAKYLKCCTTLIYRILRKNSIQMRPRGKGNKDKKHTARTRKKMSNAHRACLGGWEKASFICESYREGLPVKDIAKHLGCSGTSIYRILHENNVQVRSSKRSIGTELREKADFICKSYREDMPVKEIAGDLGCTEVSIYKILRQNGVQVRSSKRDIGIDLREKASFICKFYHEGMLVKEIANQLGCSGGSIYRILHENNVPVQTEGKKHSVERRKKNSEAQLGMSQEQLIFLIQWYSGWGWSQRRIARELQKGQKTIAKYAKLAK